MSKLSLQDEDSRVGSPSQPDSFVTIGDNFLTVGDEMDTSRSVSRRSSIHVERPVFTQDQFDSDYQYQQRHVKSAGERLKGAVSKCTCSGKCVKNTVLGFLPFIRIFSQYNIKTDLVGDIVAGLTVGIMQIPQGMAYAMLANVPPVVGLYVSLFPAILYFFLGTSRQVSVGTFAVISLMVGAAVDKAVCTGGSTEGPGGGGDNETFFDGANTTTAPPYVGFSDEEKCKIGVATAVTFFGGVFQILMGVMRLGFITTYLSEPLTRGFTTGCSIHVFTSQVRTIFGLTSASVPRHNGAFKIIKTYIDIFKSITKTNLAALITSCICIVVLVLTKEFLNPIIKAKIKMPFPIELLVVVFGTLASYYGRFESNYNMTVVGFIPKGIPAPVVPPLDRFGSIVIDSLIIAIVSFAISVSMSKIFAKRHNYEIDANQELYAYGLTNMGSSFFNCFMSAVSLSRSVVQDDVGGNTQLASLVGAGLIIIVLFFLGSLFEQLPNCVLAAIIVVALKGMFLQFKDLKRLSKISWIDFAIWLVAFLATVVLDVDLGLIVGLGFCLLSVVFRTQSPHVCLLGWVPQTDLYKDMEVYPAAKELPGLKIFRMEASLYYANSEYFMRKLYSKTVDPKKLATMREKAVKEAEKRSKQAKELMDPSAESGSNSIDVEDHTFTTSNSVKFLIIDCTTMGYVDSVGVSTLSQIINEFKKVDIDVYLAGCKAGVREMFDRCDFYGKTEKDILYLSIHDAVLGTLADEPDLLAKPEKKTYSALNTAFINQQIQEPMASPYSHDHAQLARSHDKAAAYRKRLKASWLRPLGFIRESGRHMSKVESDADLAPLLNDQVRLKTVWRGANSTYSSQGIFTMDTENMKKTEAEIGKITKM